MVNILRILLSKVDKWGVEASLARRRKILYLLAVLFIF